VSERRVNACSQVGIERSPIESDAPLVGALFLAAFVANCFRGALPPVLLRAVCLVRAMVSLQRPRKGRIRLGGLESPVEAGERDSTLGMSR